MKIRHPIYGNIKVPDTEEEILLWLEHYKDIYVKCPLHYIQAKIDCLEEALDIITRFEYENDV